MKAAQSEAALHQQHQALMAIEKLLHWYVGGFLRMVPAARAHQEDLKQDGWEAACRAAQGWRPEMGPLSSYAGVAIYRALWTSWRKAARHGLVAAAESPVVETDVDAFMRRASVPPEQESAVLRGEARRLYASLGERLTAHMRNGVREETKRKAVAAYVRQLEGDSGAAIGRAMKCTRQTALNLLSVAEEAALRWAAEVQREESRYA